MTATEVRRRKEEYFAGQQPLGVGQGASPSPRQHRGVVIIGGVAEEKHLQLQYFERPHWELWGLNAIRPKWIPATRWDRAFNLHRWEHLVRDWRDGLDREIAIAQAHPEVPLYLLSDWREWQEVPNRRQFPRHMGYPRDSYHAGSFDMLVAFALHEGFTEIGLHGIKLADPHAEPISARPCLEYWIGFAEARGVKVTAAPDCEILAQYHLVKSQTTYGWDDVKVVEER